MLKVDPRCRALLIWGQRLQALYSWGSLLCVILDDTSHIVYCSPQADDMCPSGGLLELLDLLFQMQS